ncbi:hypothetical protein EI94DRAFT_1700736 [Lactarius quietus]|nr:hypothetical protein EI94DRAFT_1700736 [Lactarius quietus]
MYHSVEQQLPESPTGEVCEAPTTEMPTCLYTDTWTQLEPYARIRQHAQQPTTRHTYVHIGSKHEHFQRVAKRAKQPRRPLVPHARDAQRAGRNKRSSDARATVEHNKGRGRGGGHVDGEAELVAGVACPTRRRETAHRKTGGVGSHRAHVERSTVASGSTKDCERHHGRCDLRRAYEPRDAYVGIVGGQREACGIT